MAFEINDGQIFIHANKSDNSKAPALKGDLKIDGVLYQVALWPAKSGKEGSYSGKVSVKTESAPAEPKQQATGGGGATRNDMDDVIPFISQFGV